MARAHECSKKDRKNSKGDKPGKAKGQHAKHEKTESNKLPRAAKPEGFRCKRQKQAEKETKKRREAAPAPKKRKAVEERGTQDFALRAELRCELRSELRAELEAAMATMAKSLHEANTSMATMEKVLEQVKDAHFMVPEKVTSSTTAWQLQHYQVGQILGKGAYGHCLPGGGEHRLSGGDQEDDAAV